jgi:hypothetical protein
MVMRKADNQDGRAVLLCQQSAGGGSGTCQTLDISGWIGVLSGGLLSNVNRHGTNARQWLLHIFWPLDGISLGIRAIFATPRNAGRGCSKL